MPLPIVAIVGRPNVGKSAFVNRLAGQQDAIVYDQPGVTRDRTYRRAFWRDHEFNVVDTGGLVFEDNTEFLPLIRQQALLAISQSQAVIFMVDGQDGLTAADEQIADWLRQQNIPILVAVNKCESPDLGLSQAAEFWELGIGEPFPISGIHGNGTGELLDILVQHLPAPETVTEAEDEIKIAIIGRPNVGKSSLLNAFLGEQRSIVSPIAGTTRDAIDTQVIRGDRKYRLIDTAGIRRKRSVNYGPEFFGINRAFKAINRSDVVLMVIDALEGVTDQDQKLAHRAVEEGRGCIIVVNKWDAVEDKDSYTIYEYTEKVRSQLYFLDYAPLIFVSALTGQRVAKILDQVDIAAEQHVRRVTTSVINEIIEDAVAWHSPPTSRQGKQGRIYYGTQVSSQPPTIVLFVNDPKRFNDNYRRYIERQFRESLGFTGTPLRLIWRGKNQREVERSLNRATKV
ncbi:GTP-binding protein engA [Thalassoporum mexicanum PCC 7367]|uniref:ribosome biogenesis GTPase Der n=1 Tax=Thalassoporum mexicanum TaxID=3457544 RepID=UPI00029FC7E6|nr:ribosome biogenesis GTPase Der [Pseudanabaena sp. PCC 7367]AFY71519.1 GTP-binding protein engA [Pseudanabaena sp. PCC 7367]